MSPRIYLMWDYASSSLWTDQPHHGMVTLESLPLRAETKAALQAWSPVAREADRAVDDQALAAHREEGLRLWVEVREQLAGSYEVGFALFDPDPDDRHSAIKRIVWDPAQIR